MNAPSTPDPWLPERRALLERCAFCAR